MRSIAYRRIRLVNKKTAIVAKMTPHIGIKTKREAGEYVRYPFLVILLGCVILRLRVLRYLFFFNLLPTTLPGLSSRTSFRLAFLGSKDQIRNLNM